MEWWDFDKTENEKTKKTQKLSATLNMAWQLIASEKKLIGAAAFLMVGVSTGFCCMQQSPAMHVGKRQYYVSWGAAQQHCDWQLLMHSRESSCMLATATQTRC